MKARRTPRRRPVLAAAVAALVLTAPAAAQDAHEVDVPRMERPITLDGRVDDAEWAAIPTLPLIQFWPTWGDPVEHPTEIRIAYDDDYVYVSARCEDTQPPTKTTYRRDAWAERDDQVAIAFDSYNDSETALAFAVYATGARIDAQFSDDARTGNGVSTDWNTYWDAETTTHATGWEVEMRIPLSSLRFETTDGAPVTMGINVFRYRADGGYLYQYPGTPNDWGYWSFMKPSKGARRDFHGITSSKPLYVSPYVTGGLGQAWELNPDGTAYVRDDEPTYNAGLDVKYSLTSNLTLDLTVNTDFAQVEADDQQVNLTRFSLFFPEKRQFFLERSSNFEFSFGGSDRLFYSRRIGLGEGRNVTLLGGGRVVGRIGGWDVGLLTMQSARETVGREDPVVLPSENFGVLRLKRRVLNENSYLGGITTSRVDEDGAYNVAYGLDGVVNVTGDEVVRFNWAQTFEDGRGDALTSLDNSRFRFSWERNRSTGIRYDLGVSRSGLGYRPAVGFQRREDFTRVGAEVGYGKLTESGSRIRNWSVEAEVEGFHENRHGHLGTVTAEVGGTLEFRSGSDLRARVSLEREDLNEGFSLSDDADIPKDTYTFTSVEMGGSTRTGVPLILSGEVRAGQFYDGSQMVVSLSPNWSLSERFTVSGTYQFNRIRFPDRDQAFDAHVVRTRIDLMFDTHFTLSSFLQVNSAADAAIANVRFRYNPRDGNDFYLVYNHALNTDRHAADPTLPLTSGRTLLAKYVHTFRR